MRADSRFDAGILVVTPWELTVNKASEMPDFAIAKKLESARLDVTE
jgi:hypothetical protein